MLIKKIGFVSFTTISVWLHKGKSAGDGSRGCATKTRDLLERTQISGQQVERSAVNAKQRLQIAHISHSPLKGLLKQEQ